MDKGMRCVPDYTFLFLLPLLFFFFFSSLLFHSISSSDDICSLALSPLNTSHTSPMMMMISLTREAHQTPGTHSFTSSYFFLSFIFLQGRRGGGEEGRRGGEEERRRGGEEERRRGGEEERRRGGEEERREERRRGGRRGGEEGGEEERREERRRGGEEERRREEEGGGGRRREEEERRRFRVAEFVVLVLMLTLQLSFTTKDENEGGEQAVYLEDVTVYHVKSLSHLYLSILLFLLPLFSPVRSRY